MKYLLVGLVSAAAALQQVADPESETLRIVESQYAERLADDPDDAVLHYDLGTVILLSGRYDEARPHLETAEPTGQRLLSRALQRISDAVPDARTFAHDVAVPRPG